MAQRPGLVLPTLLLAFTTYASGANNNTALAATPSEQPKGGQDTELVQEWQDCNARAGTKVLTLEDGTVLSNERILYLFPNGEDADPTVLFVPRKGRITPKVDGYQFIIGDDGDCMMKPTNMPVLPKPDPTGDWRKCKDVVQVTEIITLDDGTKIEPEKKLLVTPPDSVSSFFMDVPSESPDGEVQYDTTLQNSSDTDGFVFRVGSDGSCQYSPGSASSEPDGPGP